MSLKLKIAPRRSDGVRSTISACDDPGGSFQKGKVPKRKRQSAAAAWRHLDALLDALLRLVIHRPPAPVEVHLQHSRYGHPTHLQTNRDLREQVEAVVHQRSRDFLLGLPIHLDHLGVPD